MLKSVLPKSIPVFLAAAAVFGAEPVKVRYAPDDGEAFVSVSTVTRIADIGEQKPGLDVSKTKSRVVVHRTEDGFENSVTVLSTEFEHDGRSIASPLFAAMMNFEVTYRLDAAGKLLAITGYEKLADALKAKFPAAISQAMAPLLNYHAMQLQATAEYRERYERFVGAVFTPGTTQTSVRAHALPYGGTIPVYVVTEVGGLSDCGQRRCLELEQTYNSDAEKLRGSIDVGALKAAAKDVKAEPPANYTMASVEGSGTIVLEPETLFVASRNFSDYIEIEASRQLNDTVHISMRELREFTNQRESESGH